MNLNDNNFDSRRITDVTELSRSEPEVDDLRVCDHVLLLLFSIQLVDS